MNRTRPPSLRTFERKLINLNRWVLIFLLAAMSIIIFVNVVLRYTTNQSLEWAEEVSRHLMIWLTFIGAGLVLRHGGHIAVENLQDALPRAGGIAVRALVAVLLFAFFFFMIWYGWLYMQSTMFQVTATTRVPFAYIYSAMVIGGVLLVVHFLLIVRGYVLRREFPADADFDANASASL